MESIKEDKITKEMSEKIVEFFSGAEIEAKARKTKFVQRKSELTGRLFLQGLVMGFWEKADGTLTHLAQVFDDVSITISAQGIDERINVYSVEFMKEMLAHAIEWFNQGIALIIPILRLFTAVYIVDSTFFQLPEEMRDEYPGAGGNSSPASLKIQLVFDYLLGQFRQIGIQAGKCADQAYREYLKIICPGSLTIMDLGYFCLDAFVAIANAAAFFISRYHYPTGLLTLDRQRIEIVSWLREQTQDQIEVPVLLGCRARHRLPCRLLAVRVSNEAAQHRREKAIRKADGHGEKLSADYLELLGWSLFVTNVPAKLLNFDQVILFYHIRWQIELLFKLWKSYAGLNIIHSFRRERVLTELFAKLIGCVLFQFIINPARIPDDDWDERELSFFKAHRVLSRQASKFLFVLSHPDKCFLFLQHLFSLFLRFALKQKRILEPSTCQRLIYA